MLTRFITLFLFFNIKLFIQTTTQQSPSSSLPTQCIEPYNTIVDSKGGK